MSDSAVDNVVSGRAWAEFCDALKAAGEEVLRPGVDDPLDVAEGYRMLTRLLRGSLESRLEYGDPAFPALICTCHETIKIVAENPDNLYLGSSISGRYDYRIWGTRGEARWISFNTFNAGGFGGTGGTGTRTTLHEHQLHIEPDGTFEITLSQRPHPGNWLALEPDTTSVTVRQTFLHKATDRPAELHIERVGADGATPAPLTPAHLARSLLGSAAYVHAITSIGTSWAERNAARPNEFYDAQEDDTRLFKDPEIAWNMAYVALDEPDALVVEFTPPRCDYWMVALHNFWMETLDYRFHPVTLNSATAHAAGDGSVRVIVSHVDPGLPNWLSMAGHRRGVLGARWVGAGVVAVVPTTTVVPVRVAAAVSPSLVNHVGLTVSDLEASVAFYTGVVGLEVQARARSGGEWFDTLTHNRGAVIDVVMMAAPGVVVQLVQYERGGNADAVTGHNRVGNVHLCINVADVDAKRAAVVAAGLAATPIVALPAPGMRSFYTADPDGVPVEFLQPGPATT